MKSSRLQKVLNHFVGLLLFAFIFVNAISAFAGPGRTTYQAKIVKPDGYPLEASNVNFKFTMLDPTGSCVLYVEDYSNVNMVGGGGLISLTLGNGVRSYPSSGTLTFAQVFDNATPMFNCQTPGAYNPTSTDNRKIVMQFNDGNGWQTLPAMGINAVPYAMYAAKSQDSLTLNGKADTAFVQKSSSDIPTCAAGQMLYFNGASFSCVAVSASGTVTSVAAAAPLSSSGGSTPTISMTQATSSTNGYLSATDWNAFNNKQSATSGAIIASLGYTPLDSVSQSGVVSGTQYTKVTVDGKGRVTSGAQLTNSDVTTALGYTPANSATTVSSQWVTTGSNIYYNTGNVGVGTTTPYTKLEVSGGVKIGMELSSCAANFVGTLRYNAGSVEFCNGTTWAAFGVSSSGLTSLNGSTSQTQTFANGSTGNAPAFNTTNGVHTLNIPLASATGSVAAGLISNADYISFSNKITSSAASIAQVLGYVPASATALGNYLVIANNLSDLTSSATARTNLGLGTLATANSIDLGSASATGIIADARFAGQSNVTSGTQYTKVTVDGKGRVTSGAQLSSSDVTTALGYTPANSTSATQWVTNGTTINYTAGNVGIGTSTPGLPLDVFGSGARVRSPAVTNNALYLDSTSATGPGAISTIYLQTGGVTQSYIQSQQNNKLLEFGTSNTTRMVVDGSGNVGVGTTSPVAKLDVAGNTALNDNKLYLRAANDDNWKIHWTGSVDFHVAGATSSPRWRFIDNYDTANPRMVITGNGAVGVGTTTPTAVLHLKAGTATANTAPLKFTNGTLLTSPESGTIEYDGNNFYLTDGTNTRRTIATGSSAGTIDNAANINNASGNITMYPNGGAGSVIVSATTASTNSSTGALVVKGGLGVAGNINTAANLNVSGSSVIDGSLKLSSMTSGSVLFAGTSGVVSQDNVNFYWDGANKRLGIGTTIPSAALDVAGQAFFGVTNKLKLQESSDALSLQGTLATDDNQKKSILLNAWGGNVGVGTTSPQSKFTITGGGIQTDGLAASGGGVPGNALIYSHNAAGGYIFAAETGNDSDTGFIASAGGAGRLVMETINGGRNRIHSPYLYNLSLNETGGNVGIGTSTPAATLDVSGGIRSAIASDGNFLTLQRTTQRIHSVQGVGQLLKFISDSANTYDFQLDASNRNIYMATGGGNVGIGTAAPTAKLALYTSGDPSGPTTGLNVLVDQWLPPESTSQTALKVEVRGGRYANNHIGVHSKAINVFNSGLKAFFGESESNSAAYSTAYSVYGKSTNTSANFGTQAYGVYGEGVGPSTGGTVANNQGVWGGYFKSSGSGNQYGVYADAYHTGTPISGAQAVPLVVATNGSELMRVQANGNVGIGTTAPTAVLHLKAGIAAANTAPLKFTSGTLLTSPESGTVEYDGTNLYFTDGTNTRRTLAATAGSGTYDNAATISNSSGNITMYPNSGAGSVVVSATTASTNSSTGAMIVKGGLGVAGNINTAANLNVSGSSVVDGSLKLSSMTSGSILFAGANGTITQDNSNFYWDGANKRLGIGTTSPSWKLQIRDQYPYLAFQDTDNASGSIGTITYNQDGNFYFDADNPNTGMNSGYHFRANGATKYLMSITNSGTVGIGTTTPTAKLDVIGDIRFSTAGGNSQFISNVANRDFDFQGNTPANRVLTVHPGANAGASYSNIVVDFYGHNGTTNTAGFTMLRSGNIGMGTTTPSYGLTVANSKTTNSGTMYVDAALNSSGKGLVIDSTTRTIGDNSVPAFEIINRAGTNTMAATVEGNVGVGTTSPSFKLDVKGPIGLFSGALTGGTFDRTVIYSDDVNNFLFEAPVVSGTKYNTYFSHRGDGVGGAKMVITGTGYVGIGSAVASSPLHVKGHATGGETLRLSPPGGGTEGGQVTLMDAVGTGGWEIDNWGSDGQEKLRIFRDKGENNVTNAFTISASGTVGIGTFTPNTNNPLHVAGTTGAMLRLQGTSAQGNNWIIFDNNGSDLGYVGFGSSGNKGMNLINYQNDKLSLGTSNTEIIYILPAGNVGIGVATPGAALQVGGGTGLGDILLKAGSSVPGDAGDIIFQNNSGTQLGRIWTDSSSSTLYLTGRTTNSPDLTLNSSGNVGIGTASPASKLHVVTSANGTAATFSDNTNSTLRIQHPSAGIMRFDIDGGNQFSFANAGTERVRIDGSGNVGIGLTNPTYQLQLSTDSAAKPGTSSWTIASDKRLKDIRAPFTRGMNELLGLNTIYFNYKKDNPLGLPSDKEYVGIKAQDVQKVIPEAVSVDEQGYLHVTNDSIIWTAVNAIKEIYKKFLDHDEQITSQQRQIAELKVENAAKTKELEAMKAYLCSKDPAAPICK